MFCWPFHLKYVVDIGYRYENKIQTNPRKTETGIIWGNSIVILVYDPSLYSKNDIKLSWEKHQTFPQKSINF